MNKLDIAVKALTCRLIQDERQRRQRGEQTEHKPGSLAAQVAAYVDTAENVRNRKQGQQ